MNCREWLRPHGHLVVEWGWKLQAAVLLRCVVYRVPQGGFGPGWRVAEDWSEAIRWFPKWRLMVALVCPVARFFLKAEYCERPAQIDRSRIWRDSATRETTHA